jgi:hypothetical protein
MTPPRRTAPRSTAKPTSERLEQIELRIREICEVQAEIISKIIDAERRLGLDANGDIPLDSQRAQQRANTNGGSRRVDLDWKRLS